MSGALSPITECQAIAVSTTTAPAIANDGSPCLMAMPRLATSADDTSGYYLCTPELSLLAETEMWTNATKAIAYSYLWFAGMPVASIQASTNTTRWYFTDHLGTPLLQTDATAAVVWRAEQSPYGRFFSYRAGASLHQPLRFPGQIAQDTGDLSYNVFRWYRSTWGRYTQPDPLSLAGSLNLFGYVDADPVNSLDPDGRVRIIHTFSQRFFNAELGGEQGLEYARATAIGICVACQHGWRIRLTLRFDHGYSCAFPYQCRQERHHANIESAFVSRAAENYSTYEHQTFTSPIECDNLAHAYARDLERYVTDRYLWDDRLRRDFERAQSDYEGTHHGWCAPGWQCAD